MIDVFNFKGYSHHMGGGYYEEMIKKDVPAEHIVRSLDSASFLLSDYYPLLIRPSKTSVHYNTYNSCRAEGTIKEEFFKSWEQEIRSAFNNGFEFLMFVDEDLVANDRFIYGSKWDSQPISMIGKMSSFLYITVAFPHKTGMVYFVYPIRTEEGGKLLEIYHGRYFSQKGTFNVFGENILTNLIRLSYGAQHFSQGGFKRSYATEMPEDLKSYQIVKFMQTVKKESGAK